LRLCGLQARRRFRPDGFVARRFEPCEWSDLSCHALVDIAAVSGTPLRGIVGHHKNAGTWLKGYEEAPPTPFALRLRLRLRRDTWVTLVRQHILPS
jgi:hypothetical protein